MNAGAKFEASYESAVNRGKSPDGAAQEVENQMNNFAGTSSREARQNFVNDYNRAVTQSVYDRKHGSDPSEGVPLSRATILKDGSIDIQPTNDFGNR